MSHSNLAAVTWLPDQGVCVTFGGWGRGVTFRTDCGWTSASGVTNCCRSSCWSSCHGTTPAAFAGVHTRVLVKVYVTGYCCWVGLEQLGFFTPFAPRQSPPFVLGGANTNALWRTFQVAVSKCCCRSSWHITTPAAFVGMCCAVEGFFLLAVAAGLGCSWCLAGSL